MSYYVMPNTDALDQWIRESQRLAQGKKQENIAKEFSKQYQELREYAAELTRIINERKRNA